jgi:hypothetical protein
MTPANGNNNGIRAAGGPRLSARLDVANLFGLRLREGADPHGAPELYAAKLDALRAAIREHESVTARPGVPRRPADHSLYRAL